MTREQLIKQAAEQFADREHGTMRDVSVFNLLQYAFKCGAEWADITPGRHEIHKPYDDVREVPDDVDWYLLNGFLYQALDIADLWHEAKVKPRRNSNLLLYDGWLVKQIYNFDYDWEELRKKYFIEKWVYTSNLSPI